jgi:hypothetical protein
MRVDHRTGERVPRDNRLTIRTSELGGGTALEARLVDVAPGGLGIETPAPLEKGQRLRARIEFDISQIVSQQARFVEGIAVVTRGGPVNEGGPYRYGLRWDRLPAPEAEKWKTFLGRVRPSMF